MRAFAPFVLGVALAGVVLAVAPRAALAQTAKCETSQAVAHVKRVSGPRGDVTLRRASGLTLRAPSPLTPLCKGDRVATKGRGLAVLEVYGSEPVSLGEGRAWTAPDKASSSVAGNVWALFVDRLVPDLARVQVQQRAKGPRPEMRCQIAGITDGLAVVHAQSLGARLFIPCSGTRDGAAPQLVSEKGSIGGQVTPDGLEFDTASLGPGRHEIRFAASQGQTARIVGSFIVVDSPVPGPQTDPAQSPYDSATVRGLTAVWLSRENPARHGLMAWQLAEGAQLGAAGPDGVRRLILRAAPAP